MTGPARALAAHLRLGGLRAVHIDDGTPVETIRHTVAELVAGKLDVLVSVNRLAGRQSIPGLSAVMCCRPTIFHETHLRYIGRAQPLNGEVVIYDLVGNCARHGLPEDWSATTVVGPATEIIRDPYIDKLADLPHRTAMAWAGKNIDRLVLVQRAKGHKDGWTFHAIQSFDPVAADQWWAARGKSSRPSGNENNGPPATGPPKEKPG